MNHSAFIVPNGGTEQQRFQSESIPKQTLFDQIHLFKVNGTFIAPKIVVVAYFA
jgi:hypothetical protein